MANSANRNSSVDFMRKGLPRRSKFAPGIPHRFCCEVAFPLIHQGLLLARCPKRRQIWKEIAAYSALE
jgi:hypothetical protein